MMSPMMSPILKLLFYKAALEIRQARIEGEGDCKNCTKGDFNENEYTVEDNNLY